MEIPVTVLATMTATREIASTVVAPTTATTEIPVAVLATMTTTKKIPSTVVAPMTATTEIPWYCTNNYDFAHTQYIGGARPCSRPFFRVVMTEPCAQKRSRSLLNATDLATPAVPPTRVSRYYWYVVFEYY